jgi:predicted Rossmann fold nucleotide-binding protein DprA/Smf involved in DNA uptake
MAKSKTVRVGNVTVTQISPKERELLAEKILTDSINLSDMSTGNFEMIRRYAKRSDE